MEREDHLYDVTESAQVRFIGFVSEKTRHDFGIIYTSRFFGKPLVVCLQTGQSSLLGLEDSDNPQVLQRIFRLSSLREAEELSKRFQDILPSVPFMENQY